METIDKYRKQKENYVPYQVHYDRIYKHQHSHQRFVVPWQMEDVKPERGSERNW